MYNIAALFFMLGLSIGVFITINLIDRAKNEN